MIYVNQKQLDQVEYLIEQSAKGHHVLFDIEVIRRVFERVGQSGFLDPAGLSQIAADSKRNAAQSQKKPIKSKVKKAKESNSASQEEIEKHIENIILQPTLLSKRAYLENLNPDVFDRVVYTYFSIVENNIFESLQFSQ